MIVKMIILRLLGSSDDKEKIGKIVGRTDAMVFWCRRKSKPSQLIGTG